MQQTQLAGVWSHGSLSYLPLTWVSPLLANLYVLDKNQTTEKGKNYIFILDLTLNTFRAREIFANKLLLGK